MMEIKIPTRREWYPCPYCGQHLLVYTDTAVCSGLYAKNVKLVFLSDSQSLSAEDFETPEQPATKSPLFYHIIYPSNMADK